MAAYADVVESVDRAKLVGAARPRGATSASHDVDVLLQVSLDPPGAGRPGRAPTPTELAALAADVEARRACSGCAA